MLRSNPAKFQQAINIVLKVIFREDFEITERTRQRLTEHLLKDTKDYFPDSPKAYLRMVFRQSSQHGLSSLEAYATRHLFIETFNFSHQAHQDNRDEYDGIDETWDVYDLLHVSHLNRFDLFIY
jgi:hypothetical protein